MNIKQYLIRIKLFVWAGILFEKIKESFYLVGNLATGWIANNPLKLRSLIQIEAHALEKGMSIGDVKKNFGVSKFNKLLKDINIYHELGGDDKELLNDVFSILNNYLDFITKQDFDTESMRKNYNSFKSQFQISDSDRGGISVYNEDQIKEMQKSNFYDFAISRHSIRDFGNQKIAISDIRRALKLAETTPSACNRQSWKVYVISKESLKNQIFKLQEGCKGFSDTMQYAILICMNTNSYSFQEQGLMFVDGGLYGMNLLYCLHYYGLATIPLSMGKNLKGLKRIQKSLKMPVNELPVLLIGVGSYKESFKVAKSGRFSYEKYCTFV